MPELARATLVENHRPATRSRTLVGQSGFALLEILIGGVFLALAIISMALMVSQGQSYVVADGDERVAVALVRQKIEAVRSLGFPCIPLTSGSGDPTKDALPGCPGYTGTPSVADTPEAQAARTYTDTPARAGDSARWGPAGARYTSRITVVVCADPSTLQPATCPDPIVAKLISVELSPQMAQARGIRVETVVTRSRP